MKFKTAWQSVAIGMLWILLSMGAQAAAKIYPHNVMMGQPITLLISGYLVESDFEKLDLRALSQNFAIESIDGDTDRLRIKLYPLRTGKLHFPELKHGLLHVKPIEIKVSENPKVQVTWEVPKSSLFENQLGYWQAKVTVNNSAFLAEQFAPYYPYIRQHEWQGKEEPITQSSTLMGETSVFKSLVQFDSAGNYILNSPGIRVKNDTNQRWLFFAPAQYIKVKKLPSYLPAAIPLGEVSVAAGSLPFWVEEGALNEWKLVLTGQDVPIENLPNLSQQMQGGGALEWLMPQIEKHAEMTQSGLISTAVMRQPYRINSWGLASLPELKIAYFDPESQKLKSFVLEGHIMVALPAVFLWGVKLIGWLIMLVFGLTILSLMHEHYAKYRLMSQLHKSESIDEIWLALQSWSKSRVTESSLKAYIAPKKHQAWFFLLKNSQPIELSQQSIGQWHHQVAERYGSHEALGLLTMSLNMICYSAPERKLSEAELKKTALQWAVSLPNWRVSIIPGLLLKFFAFIKH